MKLVFAGLGLLVIAASAQEQINVVVNDEGKVPVIRRTDPRDESALLKIVEQNSPGAMAALFSLGYLRDPSPRTRDVLREAARSTELLTSYPAICSLWRIDDAEWQPVAAAALPRLAKTQQMHVASLLFRAGEFSRWPLMREQLLDLLAVPGSEERLKADVFQIIASAWTMKDESGREGAPLRDLRRLLATRPDAGVRERVGKLLDEFDPKTLPLIQ